MQSPLWGITQWFCKGGGQVNENELSRMIVDSAIEVHRVLGGPGLLESVYEEALAWELSGRGFCVERQYELPVIYKGNLLGTPLRIDLLVERQVVVEVKATSNFNPIFESQCASPFPRADITSTISPPRWTG